jgi:hypothetical protein
VRCQHRTDQCFIEKSPELRRADTGILGTVYRMGDGSRARRRPGEGMRARSANVMLVLGDVGEVREVAERPYDLHGLTGRQIVQDGLQRVPRRLVVVAMEADRRLPNASDDIEDRFSLLFSDSVAKNTAEQPDVVPQRPVLSRALDSLIHICDLFRRHNRSAPQRTKARCCSIAQCGACGDGGPISLTRLLLKSPPIRCHAAVAMPA